MATDGLDFGADGALGDGGGLGDLLDLELDRLLIELDELGVSVDDPPIDRAIDLTPVGGPAGAAALPVSDPPVVRDPELARLTDLSRTPKPSIDLAPPWIDPSDMPFTPQPRPGRSVPSRIFSMMVSALFLAAVGWLIIPELDLRFLHQNELRYRNGILTAQPIPLSSTYPAVVEELYIDYASLDDEILEAGTPIALLRRTGTDGVSQETEELVVPIDARFVSVDAPEGSVIYPGQPVITVYDPTLMSVLVTINAGDLERLRRGMVVRLTNEAVPNTIHGFVDSAVPLLGTDHEPTTARLVNIRIRPEPDEVTDLVPGIRFRVVVETDSVGDEAPELVFTGVTTEEAGADAAAASDDGDG